MSEDTKESKTRTSIGRLILLTILMFLVVMILSMFIMEDPDEAYERRMQWVIGKAGMGTIATAIKKYAAEVGVDGKLPPDNDFSVLVLEESDLDGGYYNQSADKMFSFSVSSLEPLKFTVTAVNEDLEPKVMTLDQDGVWTEKQKTAAEVEGGRTRVMHFPLDRSMGTLQIGRWNIKDLVWGGEWPKSVQAKGDVHVPVGQDVYLLVNEEASKDITPLADLGPDDLQVLSFSSRGGSSISDEMLSNLSGLTGLKQLSLRSTQVKGPGLKHLSKLTSLEVLIMGRTNLTDDAVKYIAKIKSLKRLGLDDTLVTDVGISYLNELKSLETLTLYRTAVTGKGFSNFSSDHSLREVLLNFSDVTNDGLAHLTNLKSLEVLSLYKTKISEHGLVHLKDLVSLRELNLQNTKVKDAGLEHIAKLTSLERLELPRSTTDAGLEKLKDLKKLKHLHIGNMKLTGTGLKVLENFKQLEYLQLPQGISDNDLAAIKDFTLLEELWIQNSPVTNKGLANLSNLKSLKKLGLHNGRNDKNMEITGSGLAHLKGLPLTSLRLWQIKLDDSRLSHLAGLTQLEELHIEGIPLRDDDLANLANLRKLKTLFFGSKTVSDGGIAHLSNLTAMEDLAPSVPMTDEGLKHFVKMKKLHRLQVGGDFTNEGLKYIESLKSLTTLRISTGNDISLECQEKLKKALPFLRSLKVIKKTEVNSRPKADQTAPSFACESLDGKKLNLDDYRGKVLLMYFWATWCSPCVASTPALKQFHSELSRYKDFAMISFSLDEDDFGVRQHVRRNGLSWPQVRLGQQSHIGTEYGVRAVPAYILVGPDGKILSDVERNWGKIEAMVAKALDASEGFSDL